jgi:hypothetical protein
LHRFSATQPLAKSLGTAQGKTSPERLSGLYITVNCPFHTWQKNRLEAVVLGVVEPFAVVVVPVVVLFVVLFVVLVVVLFKVLLGEVALGDTVVSGVTLGKLELVSVWVEDCATLRSPLEEAIAIRPASPTENISRKSALTF